MTFIRDDYIADRVLVAADEIKRLRAENERLTSAYLDEALKVEKLTAALEEIARIDTHIDPKGIEWAGPCREIVRAALETK